MSARPQPEITEQDYLAMERLSETKHEFINGEIYAMTGASRMHNLVNGNTFAALHQQLRRRPCEIYNNDMRVKITDTGLYTYPDIAALCGDAEFLDDEVDTLLNPMLIIEVLSKSTENYDRGGKFAHYRGLPSLQDYLLITPNICLVEHFSRQTGNRRLLTEYRQVEDSIPLTSLDCTLALRDVYEKVEFSN